MNKRAKIITHDWGTRSKVYKQFFENPLSVLISYDSGETWQMPPIDSGKWGSGKDTSKKTKR